MDEVIKAVKTLAAQSIAALNHVSIQRSTAPGPVPFDVSTPADPQAVPVPSTPITGANASPVDDGISSPSGGTPAASAQAEAPFPEHDSLSFSRPLAAATGVTPPAKVDPWA